MVVLAGFFESIDYNLTTCDKTFHEGGGALSGQSTSRVTFVQDRVIQSKYPISIINKVSPVSLFKVLRI